MEKETFVIKKSVVQIRAPYVMYSELSLRCQFLHGFWNWTMASKSTCRIGTRVKYLVITPHFTLYTRGENEDGHASNLASALQKKATYHHIKIQACLRKLSNYMYSAKPESDCDSGPPPPLWYKTSKWWPNFDCTYLLQISWEMCWVRSTGCTTCRFEHVMEHIRWFSSLFDLINRNKNSAQYL